MIKYWPQRDYEPFIDIRGLVYADDTNSREPAQPYASVDELVAEAVGADMLEDEPFAEQHLMLLRKRLEDSIAHVDQALALVRGANPPRGSRPPTAQNENKT